jgi:biopolymer transport protein ExbD
MRKFLVQLNKLLGFVRLFLLTFLIGICVFAYFNRQELTSTKVAVYKVLNFDENISCIKPDPLRLVIELDRNRNIKVNSLFAFRDNSLNFGNLDEFSMLKNNLKENFIDREKHEVFREGTKIVEKTIIIKADESLKYSEVFKFIQELKKTGAEPIQIQTEKCLYTIGGKCEE